MPIHSEPAKPQTAADIIDALGRGERPQIERMPAPAVRVAVAMRDGTALDTSVWLPAAAAGSFPTILIRTPYREEVLGWKRLGILRYLEFGYALVVQLVRGTGASEGEFSWNAPHERTDGYDSVEWVAQQRWSDGNVGMDLGSYSGMTSMSAAVAGPPHLRCVVPTTPVVDFFREIPYVGGSFSRQHTLSWTKLISVEDVTELTGGLVEPMPILARPEWLQRVTSRPAIDAADGLLTADKLTHYQDVLQHPTFDSWWRERTLGPADYAQITIPMLLVTGNFDTSIGCMTIWTGLAEHAPAQAERWLVVGPWDHSQAYIGGTPAYGPYDFGGADQLVIPFDLRLAFFDRYLKSGHPDFDLDGQALVYITGANRWQALPSFPPPNSTELNLFLHSAGSANTARGDGALSLIAPEQDQPADCIISDPELPFVPVIAASANRLLDVREHARHSEILVFRGEPQLTPLTVVGEGAVHLSVAVDTPDADVVVWLAQEYPDGKLVQLATGNLRLRYRYGFDQQVPMEPGQTVPITIPLTYIGHEVSAGHRLTLLVGSSKFPLLETNANTGESTAYGTRTAVATLHFHHDADGSARVSLPVLEQ